MKIPSSCKTKRLQKQRSRNCAWLFSSNLVSCMSWRSMAKLPRGFGVKHALWLATFGPPGQHWRFPSTASKVRGLAGEDQKVPTGPKGSTQLCQAQSHPRTLHLSCFSCQVQQALQLTAHVPYGSRALRLTGQGGAARTCGAWNLGDFSSVTLFGS